MVEIKITINDVKAKRSYTKKLESNPCLNMKIGSVINGNEFGLDGYELQITGGSDIAGFPMRKDLSGIARRKIYSTKTKGIREPKEDGERRRKTVAPNTITTNIAQINMKITKYGEKSVTECLGIAEKKEELAETPASA